MKPYFTEITVKVVIANWKMNGTLDFAANCCEKLNNIKSKYKVIICPPASFLHVFQDFHHSIGAQNCYCEDCGAFTGEISPVMLKNFNCEYVILGHSERRSIFCENDDIVAKKHASAVRNGLKPIVCIGETFAEKDSWKAVLTKQLSYYLNKDLHETIFAYEPVWSIGTGQVPIAAEIETVFSFIAQFLSSSENFCLAYGGSVNASNADQFLENKAIHGVLIGGCSLKIDEFISIIKD